MRIFSEGERKKEERKKGKHEGGRGKREVHYYGGGKEGKKDATLRKGEGTAEEKWRGKEGGRG